MSSSGETACGLRIERGRRLSHERSRFWTTCSDDIGRTAPFSPHGQTFALVRDMPLARQSTWDYEDGELVRSVAGVSQSHSVNVHLTDGLHYSFKDLESSR